MVDGWEWDDTLFQGSAPYYERGRLPYAPGFAGVVADLVGLRGRDRLLDVGCGPGTVTLALAPYVGTAVGLDPDPGMLAEAERRATSDGVTGVRWVRARAEDLPAGLGTFRVVVFAQSFHWTDRDRVAATVRGMLAPGGWLVHLADVKTVEPVPTAPPHARIRELVREYLGPVRRAGQGSLPHGTPGREDLVLARAGFVDHARRTVPAGQVVSRTVDDIAAGVYSRSDSAPHLFGDRLPEFDRDLRVLLRDAEPAGGYTERLPGTEIMTWRTPA